VLARAITATPPNVVLPAIVGAVGSLNTFVALVGPSGAGKDAALTTAADAIDFGYLIKKRGIGTGQGIMGQYVKTRKVPGTEGEPDTFVSVQVLDRLLVAISEIHGLKSSSQQQGANILPVLADAWSGSLLGGTYKDARLDIEVDAHTYRLGVVAGVQPGEAEILTRNDALGLPQRFVWMPAADVRAATDNPPEWPGTMTITLPDAGPPSGDLEEIARPGFRLGDRVEMTVCEAARQVVIEDRRSRQHPEFDGDPLDSHSVFCRLKIAAGLALMETRLDITDDDWRISGLIMVRSSATRRTVFGHLTKKAKAVEEARRAEAIATVVAVAEATDEAAISKTMRRVLTVLANHPDGMKRNDLRRNLGSGPYRDHFAEALARLELGKAIIVDETWIKIP
jgi:hypothetical protein